MKTRTSWLGRTFGAGLICLVVSLALPSCGEDPPAPISCSLPSAPAGAERFAAIAVHLDDGGDPHLQLVKADLSHYLGALWGVPVTVESGPPAAATAIWLSTSSEAQALAGGEGVAGDGYALRRLDEGIVVWAPDAHHLAYAAYALLEELGVRFFHPKQEVVPSYDGPYLPRELALVREPAFATRGLQLHTLHPIEHFRALTEPGDENLAEVKRFIDWLAKTGHNELQWWIYATTDIEAYRPHARAIIDYAHLRGLRAGAVAQLWGGGSLQNGYTLVDSDTDWPARIEASIDELMGLGYDLIELGLGEFFATDPDQLVAWLNHATAYLYDTYPGRELSVSIHVGNYPDQWVQYQGEEVFLYHLPGYADPRLVNNVHTVFFFDLYRPWGGYGHEDFFLHHEFLLGELGERKVRYIPESAYWVTADIDVPIFLPAYIYSRWLDITGLYRDTGGALEGHVMYSSGHEWGYWMTDYLAARMLWEPEAPFEHFIAHLAGGFGSCGPTIESALGELVAIQNEYLFDRRLVGYLSGEDTHDDFGFLAGFTTTPRRIAFEEVAAMGLDERQSFRDATVGGLRAFGAALRGVEAKVGAVCSNPGPGVGPFCRELFDGIRVTRLRAEHSAALYEAVIAAQGGDGGPQLAAARERREEARAIIEGRADHYRWPREHLIGAYENPTIYPFGYLRQAHTLCYWLRQEQQAEGVAEFGAAPPIGALPTCLK